MLKLLHSYSFFIFLAIISIIFLILVTYRISDLMLFFGDIAWYYLHARDFVLGGDIPLVSMTTSHPWLHQGPYWTYLLAAAFFIGGFNPLIGFYVAFLFGLATLLGLALIGSVMFSRKVGLLAAAVYTLSPLAIIHARMPFTTTPVPFFALLYVFSLYLWVTGKKYGFPLAILFLAIIYNFNIGAMSLVAPFALLFLYGLWKRKSWFTELWDKKVIIPSILAGVIPMIPVLIYDFTHGFPQTVKFVMWMGYRILVLFGYPPLHPEISSPGFSEFAAFSLALLQRFFFLPHQGIALFLFVFMMAFVSHTLFQQYKRNRVSNGLFIVFFVTVIPLLAYIGVGTPSEAYIVIFFSSFALLGGVVISYLLNHNMIRYLVILCVVAIGILNIRSLIQQDYLTYPQYNYGYPLSQRAEVSQLITEAANHRHYNIVGKGEGSQFESFTMPYDYLGWYFGDAPSQKKETLQFIITEKPDIIELTIKDTK